MAEFVQQTLWATDDTYCYEWTDGSVSIEHAIFTSDSDEGNETVYLYRTGILDPRTDLDWVDWYLVATSMGWEKLPDFDNKDNWPMIWVSVADHYGWEELDPYPLEITLEDLNSRWTLH